MRAWWENKGLVGKHRVGTDALLMGNYVALLASSKPLFTHTHKCHPYTLKASPTHSSCWRRQQESQARFH